ncbi:MAG: pilus assembly protein TadG-related protein [Firmicutes bacterium]|jgi:hypothetical protein|nr:pilus assembly protein TadG-related protein [Bacillota bacterium]
MLGDERGSVTAMGAMVVVAALVFVAFLFDLGRAWVLRARLQAATDAAALAAVQQVSVRVIVTEEPIGDGEVRQHKRLEVELDPDDARDEARNVLLENARQWKKREPEGDVIVPEIVRDRIRYDDTTVRYELETRAQIPSLLIGPVSALVGRTAARHLNVRFTSEGAVRVSPDD